MDQFLSFQLMIVNILLNKNFLPLQMRCLNSRKCPHLQFKIWNFSLMLCKKSSNKQMLTKRKLLKEKLWNNLVEYKRNLKIYFMKTIELQKLKS